jgi:hypothetical protein
MGTVIYEGILLPCVVKDHNSKTAIAIRKGRKFYHVIPMKSGKLTVRKLNDNQFSRYAPTSIKPSDAVKQYLAHSGGHTETALNELLNLQSVLEGTIF